MAVKKKKVRGYTRRDGVKVKGHTKAVHTKGLRSKRGKQRAAKGRTMDERFTHAGKGVRRTLAKMMGVVRRRRRK